MTEELHVEIGFDANVNDPFPKWYDVTPYVISGKGKRGRSYELDGIETGTQSYLVDNATGWFTPGSVRPSNPYAGKVEPGKPIREYVIADDNWIHYQSVSPKFMDAEGPRFTPQFTGDGTPLPVVRTDSAIGRDVWEFTGAWHVGYEGDFEYVPVTAGQTVTVTALVSKTTVDSFGSPFLGLHFSATGETNSFVNAANTNSFTDVGVYHTVALTWTATVDGYVRVLIAATSGVSRVTDIKLTLDGKGTSEVAGLSGRIPVFRGNIERLSQEYHGKLSTVSVECVDGLASLSEPIKTQYRGAVDAWYRGNVKGTPSDGQFFYWTCVESDDRLSTDPVIGPHSLNVYPGTLPGSSTRGFTNAKTMVYSDGMDSGGYSVHVDDAATGTWAGAALSLTSGFNPPLPDGAASLVVDLWFLPEELPPAGNSYTLWCAVTDAANGGLSSIRVLDNGKFEFRYGPTDHPGSLLFVGPVGDIAIPGVPVHVGMRVWFDSSNQNCNLNASVNGAPIYGSSDTVVLSQRPGIPAFERVTFGQDVGIYGSGSRTFNKPMRGTINHAVMAWNVPDGFHVAVHPAGADQPDSEAVRLNNVLDSLGWTGPRRFDPSLTTLLPARWNQNDDGGTVLKEAGESAGGTFYIGPSGAAVYQNRHRRVNAPVRWTVYEWADGLRFQLDDSRVRNEIRAERVTGLYRVARDEASIDRYGRKPLTVTRDVVNDLEVADAAAWLLRRYRVAAPWCDTLRVEAHTLTGAGDATLKALAYAADMSQRLLMTDLPPDAPADEADFFIEGVETEFEIDGGVLKWVTTLSVSDVGNSMAWTLEDAASGVLESDACVLTY